MTSRNVLVASVLLLAIAAVEFVVLGMQAGAAPQRGRATPMPTATATCTDTSSSPPCSFTPVSPPPGPTPAQCPAGTPGQTDRRGHGAASPPCSPAFSIELSADPIAVVCDGQATSTIVAHVRDRRGKDVPDGTRVTFRSFNFSSGVSPTSATTEHGVASTELGAGPFTFPQDSLSVSADVGLIDATFRVLCSPESPVACPPGGVSNAGSVSPPCPFETPVPPGTPEPRSTPAGPSIGGRLSIGTPTVAGGMLTVPILTTAPQDPLSGFSVNLIYDGSLLSPAGFGAGPVLESLGTGVICVHDTFPSSTVWSCSAIGGVSTASAGVLADATFRVTAATGCTQLHIETYGPPDGGDSTTGTYTMADVGEPPFDTIMVQQNAYGPDITVNVADGSTGCGASPLPTQTLTPPRPF